MQKTKKDAVKGKREGTPGTGTQASLQVRLWAGDGGSDAEVPAGALAMVQDFLGVSPCEPVEVGKSAASGVFSDVVQAVNAGRRLQRLVQGYNQAAHGGLGAGLLLTSGDEAVSDEEMYELRQKQALSRAQPGQMFVVGALCDKVRSIPGLKFKEIDHAFAPAAAREPRRVMFVLPAVSEGKTAAEEEMKTRLVESFVNPAADGARGAAPLVLAAVGQKGSAAAVSAGLKEGARSAGSPEAAEPATGLPQAPLWARPAVRWAGAAAAALLILAAVAMGVHGKGSAKTDAAVATPPLSTAADPAAPAASAPSGNAAPPQKPVDAGKPRKPDAAPRPNGPVASAPVAAAATKPAPDAPVQALPEPKPEVVKHEPEKVIAPPPTEPRLPKPTSGGVSVSYSAEEIGMLLARADKDSGDGNYDRAIVEYRSILSHDPGNQRARQGLERAIRNKNGG